MNKFIYFDNSASTKIRKEAYDVWCDVSMNEYANPSAKHSFGFLAEKRINEARELIANTIKAGKDEIIFTSGGSESNNMALFGVANANKRRGKHIIVSSIEHSSISKSIEILEDKGYEITRLAHDEEGRISLNQLKEALRKDTILVSIMYVNNEIGCIQDIASIVKVIKNFDKEIIFHTDAVQAYTKVDIDVRKDNIDLLSVSGHKVHAPKGIGFIYIRKGVKISPLIYGGNQQNGFRSGTLNTTGIVSLASAIKYDFEDFDKKKEKLSKLKTYLIKELEKIENIRINSSDNNNFVSHIVNVSFLGVKSEVLLHALEEKNIFVSSGSACSSHKKEIKNTLSYLNRSKEEVESSIRISFSEFNEKEEIDIFINELKSILKILRRFVRK